MHDFTNEQALDVEAVRARLRRMDDAALIQFGAAARYMCSPWASLGKPPRQNFVIQLREAMAEWQRRKGSLPGK